MNKIAFAGFIAFVSSVLTLVSLHALSSDQYSTDAEDEHYTLEEVEEHNSADSCWKVIHGGVYDITDYISQHPTDEEVILEWCGRESTEGWDNKRPGVPHSARAAAELKEYRIGRLEGDEAQSTAPETQREESADDAGSPAADERLHRALLGLPLDGVYRGVFSDGGEMQVNVQFTVREGAIERLSYRYLAYRGEDYRRLESDHAAYPVWVQHEQIAERLEGKPLTAIFQLYEPERLIDDVDGYSGATLRGNKVLSAIRDGLNRGVYSWP
ncbi:MAG: cytochrome b5 domain-containing protein [Halomonas sp.]|nr:cytochrome b5 domain-containing protein [Halomonas sp.]MBR2514725.1 cytochrome b5 domain-containing protein [Halomonas sp.]